MRTFWLGSILALCTVRMNGSISKNMFSMNRNMDSVTKKKNYELIIDGTVNYLILHYIEGSIRIRGSRVSIHFIDSALRICLYCLYIEVFTNTDYL